VTDTLAAATRGASGRAQPASRHVVHLRPGSAVPTCRADPILGWPASECARIDRGLRGRCGQLRGAQGAGSVYTKQRPPWFGPPDRAYARPFARRRAAGNPGHALRRLQVLQRGNARIYFQGLGLSEHRPAPWTSTARPRLGMHPSERPRRSNRWRRAGLPTSPMARMQDMPYVEDVAPATTVVCCLERTLSRREVLQTCAGEVVESAGASTARCAPFRSHGRAVVSPTAERQTPRIARLDDRHCQRDPSLGPITRPTAACKEGGGFPHTGGLLFRASEGAGDGGITAGDLGRIGRRRAVRVR